MGMKNLFDYATKELSQDAFLRWLFENYDCEDKDVWDASRELIMNFLGNTKYSGEDIAELWTLSQDHKADITMWIKMKDSYTFGIVIEDKTFSNEHDQLARYKKIFENNKWWQENTRERKYIFYKTGKINEWEQDIINENGWIEYSFDKIYELWNKYTNSSNLILSSYAKHIVDLYKKKNNIIKPIEKQTDNTLWESFFENVIKPKFQDYNPWTGLSFGRYAYICFRIPGFNFPGAPYLEVRNRDCFDNKFQTRILTYGMDNNKQNTLNEDDCKKIRQEIRDSIKNIGKIFKANNGIKQNKQLGVSDVTLNVDDVNSFVLILEKHLFVFKEIIESIPSYNNKDKYHDSKI